MGRAIELRQGANGDESVSFSEFSDTRNFPSAFQSLTFSMEGQLLNMFVFPSDSVLSRPEGLCNETDTPSNS